MHPYRDLRAQLHLLRRRHRDGHPQRLRCSGGRKLSKQKGFKLKANVILFNNQNLKKPSGSNKTGSSLHTAPYLVLLLA